MSKRKGLIYVLTRMGTIVVLELSSLLPRQNGYLYIITG